MMKNTIGSSFMNGKMLIKGIGSMQCDTECSGAAHLLEHMLVSFDKKGEMPEGVRIEAHTRYSSMYFLLTYDDRHVDERYITDILEKINRGETFDDMYIDICRNDVIDEIRQDNSKTDDILKLINHGQKEILRRPVGIAKDVQTIDIECLRKIMDEQFLEASWNIADIRTVNDSYKISCHMTKASEHGDEAVCELVFSDIVIYICAIIKGWGFDSVRLFTALNKRYLLVTMEMREAVTTAVKDKDNFLSSLKYMIKRYNSGDEFPLEYQCMLIADAVTYEHEIVTVTRLKKMFSSNRAMDLYYRYLDFTDKIRVCIW